jgi:hypothetical protein
MWDNTDCWASTADLGYQGVVSLDTMKQRCDANSSCRGFTKHSGGDYWLLSDVSHRTPATNYQCYQK